MKSVSTHLAKFEKARDSLRRSVPESRLDPLLPSDLNKSPDLVQPFLVLEVPSTETAKQLPQAHTRHRCYFPSIINFVEFIKWCIEEYVSRILSLNELDRTVSGANDSDRFDRVITAELVVGRQEVARSQVREVGNDERVESDSVGLVVQDELHSFAWIRSPDTAVDGLCKQYEGSREPQRDSSLD